jgi:4-pyridoxolactonase
MDMMCISSFHLDPVASVKSLHRLKELAAKHDAELLFPRSRELQELQEGRGFL